MMSNQNSPRIVVSQLSEQLQMAKLSLLDFAAYHYLTDKRSIEKQAALHMVRFVLKDDTLEIAYKESGRPYLTSNISTPVPGSHERLNALFSFLSGDVIMHQESYLTRDVRISISHSYDWIVILFCFQKNNVGIDIEKVRDKILNIKEKFLSKEELKHLQGAPPEKYTVYWCAKEAIYKALDREGLNFSEQIFIENFSYSQGGDKLKVQVSDANSKKNYTLHYQVLENYILVYTESICE